MKRVEDWHMKREVFSLVSVSVWDSMRFALLKHKYKFYLQLFDKEITFYVKKTGI